MKAGVSTTAVVQGQAAAARLAFGRKQFKRQHRGILARPADRRSLRTVRSASPVMLVVACTLFLVALTTVLHFEVLRG
jgi:hypothetical protein